eukprot:PhF_6_TR21060/c0_g1_i2/m.30328
MDSRVSRKVSRVNALPCDSADIPFTIPDALPDAFKVAVEIYCSKPKSLPALTKLNLPKPSTHTNPAPPLLPPHYVSTNNIDLEGDYLMNQPPDVRRRVEAVLLKGGMHSGGIGGGYCGVCGISGGGGVGGGDVLMVCVNCKSVSAHRACLDPFLGPNDVGTSSSSSWMCGICEWKLNKKGKPLSQSQMDGSGIRCMLCQKSQSDGPELVMVITSASSSSQPHFVHLVCARMLPNVRIKTDHSIPNVSLTDISTQQRSLRCEVCEKKEKDENGGSASTTTTSSSTDGACAQCFYRHCRSAMHPSCAYLSGLAFPISHTTFSSQINNITLVFACPRHAPTVIPLNELVSDDDDQTETDDPVIRHYHKYYHATPYYSFCPEIDSPHILRGKRSREVFTDPLLMTTVTHRTMTLENPFVYEGKPVLTPVGTPTASIEKTESISRQPQQQQQPPPLRRRPRSQGSSSNTLKTIEAVRRVESSLQDLCVLADLVRKRTKLKRQSEKLNVDADTLQYG